MARGYSFRPRLWALLLAAAACAAGVALGNWQSRRADEKRAAQPRVTVEGEFAPRYTVYLENKVRGGRVGYEVVTPLRLRGTTSHVLVNRGWVDAVKDVATPQGELRIEGVELARLPRVLELGKGSGKVRQTLDIDAFAAETGLALEPRVIEQHSATPDGLARDWPPRGTAPEKNQAYALQWYSLAALAVVLFMVLSIRRRE